VCGTCKQNPAIRHLCERLAVRPSIYLYLHLHLHLTLCFHEIARMIREKRRKLRSINRAKADRVRHVENDVSRLRVTRKSRQNKRERERERERDGDLAAGFAAGRRRIPQLLPERISERASPRVSERAATGSARSRPGGCSFGAYVRVVDAVPPGETSHSYKTDGLVAPRVSLGSRLA